MTQRLPTYKILLHSKIRFKLAGLAGALPRTFKLFSSYSRKRLWKLPSLTMWAQSGHEGWQDAGRLRQKVLLAVSLIAALLFSGGGDYHAW
jgi:hypothetical protein